MNYHLIIDEEIGPWGCSKKSVRNALSVLGKKHIDVRISSLGGNLAHAFDIRQQFKDHGDVTVYLSGGVASAATVIATGAKRIVMSKYAMFLVHKCSNFIDAYGSYNADQMDELIEKLKANKEENDKIDLILASLYAEKCNKDIAAIMPILTKGGWLTPQEALDYGFVDEISDSFGQEQKLNYTSDLAAKFNAMGIPPLPGQEPSPKSLAEDSISDSFLARICTATARAFAFLSSTPQENSNNQSSSTPEMKTYNFAKLGALLKLDSISPDKEGKVSLSAELLEQVNNQLVALEQKVADKETDIASKEAEITSLKEQVENLKKSPGDDTSDIEDDASGASSTFSASELFNSIKSAL